MPAEFLLESISVKVAFHPGCNFKCDYCGGNGDRPNSPYSAAMEDYRNKPISTGIFLDTSDMERCFKALRAAGFTRIRPTGGEPTLNPEWADWINKADQVGLKADITTNGSQLNRFLDKHKTLPSGLTMIKISLDTQDPEIYKKTNGIRGNLPDLERAIRRLAEAGVYVRLNSVLTRENCDENKIREFMKYAEDLGVKQVQYLDLVYYSNSPSTKPDKLQENKTYWEEQFVAFSEYRKIFSQVEPSVEFLLAKGQFGVNFWSTTLPSGLIVTFKDSTFTMRDTKCLACPVFCQEGRCLIRMGTDGNITPCPDYRTELPDNFNILESLDDGTFNQKLGVITQAFMTSQRLYSIEEFARRHQLKLPDQR